MICFKLLNTLMLILSLISITIGKGGVGKCLTCPDCMVCNPFVGCVYDNFSPCKNNLKNGLCFYGVCNTTIKVPSKPSVCKTYKFVGGNATLTNDINGLDCTQVGSIFKSACYKGICTPFVDGLNLLGQNVGCLLVKDGMSCDTNGVFTDGEKCVSGLCKMPTNPQDLCVL